MKLKNTLGFCAVLLTVSAAGAEICDFNQNWLFKQEKAPYARLRQRSQGENYDGAKAGGQHMLYPIASFNFDEKGFTKVNLPHDWAIGMPQKADESFSQGFHETGWGYYRKHFKLPAEWRGKHLELQFGAIAKHCTVWINDNVLARNFCSYTGFTIDLTPYAKYGDEDNLISIEVDAQLSECWSYEGAGIYRDVKLIVSDPLHISSDGGIYSVPEKKSGTTWNVPVQVKIDNSQKTPKKGRVIAKLFTLDGKEVAQSAQASATFEAGAYDSAECKMNFNVNNPQLWDLEKPNLYVLKTQVFENGKTSPVDENSTRIGFRTFRWDVNHGFFLNDKHVKIKGVCNHVDHAGVGMAVPKSIEEFRVKLTKDMGANAWRCGHNPPTESFLDLCDEYGILVLDENRHFGSSEQCMDEVAWMIKRDRNHPSVFMWNLANEEVFTQGTEIGCKIMDKLVALSHKLDSTRPTTAAQNDFMLNDEAHNIGLHVDVMGFNYHIGQYDEFHKKYPNKVVTSVEDSCAFMSRGEYANRDDLMLIDSFDSKWGSWGDARIRAWREIDIREYMAGCFSWSGFDYHGEGQPFAWPANASYFGIMDLCGFPKNAYYFHKAWWRPDLNTLKIFPHWNGWKPGEKVKVMVTGNVTEAELVLNGKNLGTFPVDKYDMLKTEVEYQPGKLVAIGKRDGKEVVRTQVQTTGAPVALKLKAWDGRALPLAGDGYDAIPVRVCAVDAQGREVESATNIMVNFKVTGCGRNIGVGNGDTTDLTPEKGDQRKIYNGVCMIILQSNRGESGNIELTATADGLKSATLVIPVVKTTLPKAL